MAFPATTTVLDDFNRASIGSNWSVVGGPGLATIGSTQLYWGGAASGDRWTANQFGPDIHFYITIATTATAELSFDFFHDLTSGSSGYSIDLDTSVPHLTIDKRTAGSVTNLATTSSFSFASGDKFGIGIEGNVITLYKFSAGSWTQLLQATDSTSPFTSVQRWFDMFLWNANWRLDDMVLATVGGAGTHFVRYRIGKNVSTGTLNFTVSLMQGTTQIAQWTHSNVAQGFTTYEQNLTSGQISSITDTTDLRLRFVTS